MSLLLLFSTGCETAVDIDAQDAWVDLDTGLYDELDESEGIAWDNPDFRPDVDRWAPDGVPIDLPLGSSNAYNVVTGEWKGEGDSAKLGISVRNGGDVNGDGLNDLIMGSLNDPTASSTDGAAYMNRAKFHTGSQRADASKGRWYGTGAEKAGEQVNGGGDLDADGNDDWIIGARAWDDSVDTWKVNSGAVYIVMNFSRGNNTLPGTEIVIDGDAANQFFGAGMDVIGDIDNDGYDDLGVGATGADTNGTDSGAVYIWNGPVAASTDASTADSTIGGESAGDGVGTRIFGLGDVDGDGVDDFGVSNRGEDTNGTDAGAVYIITASTMPATLGDADYIYRGNSASFEAGNSLKQAGDLDGDGKQDFLAGALGHGGTLGGAYVVLGGTADGKLGAVANAKMYGQLSGDQFGSDVASGDINDDDVADILVAANRQGANDRGAIYGFYGPLAGTVAAYSADVKVVGVANGDKFGSSLDYVSNTTVDGKSTVAVGASSRGTNNKGAVYLFEVP